MGTFVNDFKIVTLFYIFFFTFALTYAKMGILLSVTLLLTEGNLKRITEIALTLAVSLLAMLGALLVSTVALLSIFG